MRRFLALLLAIFGCSCPRTVIRCHTDRFHATALQVNITCLDGSWSRGSGVAVSPNHVVTAKHVADVCGGDVKTIRIVARDGIDRLALLDRRAASDVDAVLLYVPKPLPFYAAVRTGALKPGEVVCTATMHSCGCGRILALLEKQLGVDYKPVPGDSGGPLYDENGLVVAIWLGVTPGYGVATPAYAFSGILPERFQVVTPAFKAMFGVEWQRWDRWWRQ